MLDDELFKVAEDMIEKGGDLVESYTHGQ